MIKNLDKTLYKTSYACPLRNLTLISDGKNLLGVYLEGQKYYIEETKAIKNNNLEVFNKTKLWLDRYFENKKPNILELPILFKGSEFRKLVFEKLKEIPYGKTTTYFDIANKIAKEKGIEKMSAQAVGSAIGHNPILIIIPCHRVIGKQGNLGGFSAGIEAKIKLLKHENPNFSFS